MINYVRKRMPSPPVVRLFILMGIVWAAIAGPISSVLILKSMGADSAQVGVFAACGAVISMVAQPTWGLISDKIGSPRRVLCLCLGASAVLFGCVLFTDNLYVAAGLLLGEMTFRCCVVPLLDSHTLGEMSVIPGLQYSSVRMGASIMYGVMSLLNSGVIGAWGVKAIIPISTCISAMAILWGLLAAKGKWEGRGDASDAPREQRNLRREALALLHNRRYIVFVLFAGVWALATQPSYTFIIDYVTAVGGSAGDVPMIHALRCVVEIPFFVIAGSVGKRVRARTLMLAGLGFWLCYMTGLLFAGTFVTLAAVNMLAAPGFILGLAGRMRYLNDITPESVRSTSVTVMSACEIGLGSIAGNLISGFVSAAYGTRALTMVSMGAICAAMVILVLVLGWVDRAGEGSPAEG